MLKRKQVHHILHRRHIVLLEVLISFALVALCALPLIYSQVMILRSEREFTQVVDLDHAVSLLFANHLQKLYLKEISWTDIQSKKEFPIDDLMLKESGVTRDLPFNGVYKFEEKMHKPPKQTEDVVYLYKLIYTFTPKYGKANPYKYDYLVTIEYKPQ